MSIRRVTSNATSGRASHGRFQAASWIPDRIPHQRGRYGPWAVDSAKDAMNDVVERGQSLKIEAMIAALMLYGSAAFAQDVTPSRDNPSGSVVQPHGPTGPINTKSGGAPASSPQGETPPGMQAAPKGSSEAIRSDRHGVVEGTPKN
jgi:hypothetical protein